MNDVYRSEEAVIHSGVAHYLNFVNGNRIGDKLMAHEKTDERYTLVRQLYHAMDEFTDPKQRVTLPLRAYLNIPAIFDHGDSLIEIIKKQPK